MINNNSCCRTWLIFVDKTWEPFQRQAAICKCLVNKIKITPRVPSAPCLLENDLNNNTEEAASSAQSARNYTTGCNPQSQNDKPVASLITGPVTRARL